MDYKTFVAWLVWAVDTDQLSFPVDKAWEMFNNTAVALKLTFTDPKDPQLFSEKALNESPIEIITDYALFYAKANIDRGYGKLTDTILKIA